MWNIIAKMFNKYIVQWQNSPIQIPKDNNLSDAYRMNRTDFRHRQIEISELHKNKFYLFIDKKPLHPGIDDIIRMEDSIAIYEGERTIRPRVNTLDDVLAILNLEICNQAPYYIYSSNNSCSSVKQFTTMIHFTDVFDDRHMFFKEHEAVAEIMNYIVQKRKIEHDD